MELVQYFRMLVLKEYAIHILCPLKKGLRCGSKY